MTRMEIVEAGIRLRGATKSDSHAMAELVNFAGEGLPLYLWERMAADGQSGWDVGRARAARDEGAFSWRNTIIAEVDGQVAGSLVGYALPDTPEPIDHDAMPAMFVPLQELENLAPSTWYVNVLAAFPQFRGRGVGTRLLAEADRLGRAAGLKGMSVIVSDANAGARRLYERCGYREHASRLMVKESWQNHGANWVLLVKPLA